MKIEITDIGPCRRKVEIEIDQEFIEERMKQRVKEFRRSKTIPGFRPGKATDSVIRRRYGKQIRSDVLRDMVPEVWNGAIKDHNLVPVAEPDLEPVDSEQEGGLKLSGTVDIRPQVTLDEYKGLKATRRIMQVTDEDVERQLAMIREQRADEMPSDEPAKSGDIVVVTLQKVDDAGVIIIGEKEQQRRWEIGGVGSLSADLDDQMIGMRPGETKVATFHYREDMYDQERAGTQDRARIELKELYIRDVPELDDDFAKDLGDFETVEDLKTAVREDLEARSRAASSRQVQEELREAIAEKYDFDVPELLVERMLHGMFHEQEQQNGKEGDAPEDHDSEEHNRALEAFSEEHRDEAVKRVRTMLAIDIIGDQESIEVSSEQVRQRIDMMAAQYRMQPEQMAQFLANTGRLSGLRGEMRDHLVLHFLEEHAEIEEVEITGEDEHAE